MKENSAQINLSKIVPTNTNVRHFIHHKKILTSQPPRGSPLAASNPAEIIVKSGAYSEAVIEEDNKKQ